MAFAIKQCGNDRIYEVNQEPVMIGSLSSNHVTLMAEGVEPIHALLEVDEQGKLRITDLGTLRGIRINGEKVRVEATLEPGDHLTIGATEFVVTVKTPAALAQARQTVRSGTRPPGRSRLPIKLFKPETNGGGPVLEVVAYWGNTVLNVDQFEPGSDGKEQVTIGDPTKAHFIDGGREAFKTAVLADVGVGRAALHLRGTMRAKIRQSGQTKKVKGGQVIDLGRRDFAHVQHGAVRYFLHYTQHPRVKLPPPPPRSRFHSALAAIMAAAYIILVTIALVAEPQPAEMGSDGPEIYLVLPEPKDRLVKEIPEPKERKIEIREIKLTKPPVERPKPREVEPQPPMTPPKATPKPTQVATPRETPKERPREVVRQALRNSTPTTASAVQPSQGQQANAAPGRPGSASTPRDLLSKSPSIGQKTVGRPNPLDSRGERGGPNTLTGAQSAMRGTGRPNLGVEGGKSRETGMINLDRLSRGLTSISKLREGIPAEFREGGGRGQPGGVSLNTRGLGPIGGGQSLGLRGSGDNGFGDQPGGFLAGENGSASRLGGLARGSGTGPGNGPGGGLHARADVSVYDPVGGVPPDMSSDILLVIRRNLNQIRHCYNQTLQRKPQTSGKLLTAFTIGANGRVTRAAITGGNITDGQMRGCITGVIRRWKFPNPPPSLGTLNLTYPFVFHQTSG